MHKKKSPRLVRQLVNLPGVNAAMMGGLRLLGLDSDWIRSRLYRVGKYQRDGIWFVDSAGGPISRTVFWDGALAFEPEMSRRFFEDIKPGATVLDVGASMGYYSLLAGSRGCTVFAFEPSSATRQILRNHIALNGFDVTVVPVALSDTVGYADLFLPQGATDSGASLDSLHGGATQRVRVTTLDEFVDYYGLESVDVIKIDVERLEPKVIAGAVRTIRRFRPIIYCEILPRTDKAAIEAALPGYRFQHLLADGPVAKAHIEADPTRVYRNYRFEPIGTD